MDATSAYIDAPSTVLSRVGSGLQYLKNAITESFSRDSVANMSAAAAMQNGDQRRFFFPRFEGISGPPPPLPSSPIGSSGDVIANSTLRQFLSTHNRQILSILSKLLGVSISAITTYFLLKWLMKSIDPTNADKMAAKSRAEAIMKQLGVDPKTEELNEYEMVIASNIILPNQIDCSWEDIGGLDHLADELRETVIYPLRDFDLDKDVSNIKTKSAASNNNPTTSNSSNQPSTSIQTRRSKLVQPPKGVLLFGPPGNAKTMIAKALAKESGARFINLQVSTLFDKWFGESQKRTEAVFSLARKVQPAIIFIDEIDSFLRSRRIDDHECTSTMKTQFMTLWDGLTTSNQKQNRILIIGATNRPEDVDPAILRRMPQMFHIGLPNEVQRINILKVILKDENLAEDVNLDEIASRAAQFSGSDLHELCRCAAMNSFIESVRNAKKRDQTENVSSSSSSSSTTHAIRKVDFDVAFEKVAVKVVAMNMNLKDRMDFNF